MEQLDGLFKVIAEAAKAKDAEIARLTAELREARLAADHANIHADAAIEEVERLAAVNDVREGQANMLGEIRDTAWNDAIEAAEDSVPDCAMCGCQHTIRALHRPT